MHEKINSIPDGYKTKVGERGWKLCGDSLNYSCFMRPPVLSVQPQRGIHKLLWREFARTELAS